MHTSTREMCGSGTGLPGSAFAGVCVFVFVQCCCCTGCSPPNRNETLDGQCGVEIGQTTPQIKARIELIRSSDGLLRLTLTNQGTTPAWLLVKNLPGGKHLAGLFEVTRDGTRVHYQGQVREWNPVPCLQLQAGKDYSTEIALGYKPLFDSMPAYDVFQPGHYTVTYRAWNQSRSQIISNTLTFDR